MNPLLQYLLIAAAVVVVFAAIYRLERKRPAPEPPTAPPADPAKALLNVSGLVINMANVATVDFREAGRTELHTGCGMAYRFAGDDDAGLRNFFHVAQTPVKAQKPAE